MKIKSLFYIVTISTVMFSCVTRMNKYSSSPHIDIEEPEIEGYPLMADLSISKEKVKGTATMGFSSGIAAPIEECKRSAIGNALISSESDVLIEPFYIIETTESSVTVQVTGFPAKYKNFRKDTEKMAEINAVSVNQTTVYGPVATGPTQPVKNTPVKNAPVKRNDPISSAQPNSSSAGETVLGVLSIVIGIPLLILALVN